MVADIGQFSSATDTTPVTEDDKDNDSLKRQDVVSTISSNDDDDTNELEEFERNSIALAKSFDEQAIAPTFGNIAVSNSSEVHFGNKTYYQGPVTIKKVVYTGTDNLALNPNGAITASEKCEGIDNFAYNVENNVKSDGNALSQKSSSKINIRTTIKNNKVCFLSITICIMTLAVIGISLFVLLGNHSSPYPTASDNYSIENPQEPHEVPSDKLRIVTRPEWLAQAPSGPMNDLVTPVPYVIIWHSATYNCTDQASCTGRTKEIQKFHMESRNWSDIAYNFLVGGDGYVYEGRGWQTEGAHTLYYNKKSIGIAFIGTFIHYLPPKRQIDAAKKLIKMGVEENFIIEDYKLFGARQFSSTESPGQLLYEDLVTWPHWSKEP